MAMGYDRAIMAQGEREADVIVAGAGPAGAMLAGHLARTGVQVLVLEKCRFPRPKPCGGGLSRKAVGLLELDLEPLVENKCSVLSSVMDGLAPFSYDLNEPFTIMVRREAFDQALLEWARALGARALEGVRVKGLTVAASGVTVATSGGEYRARYVVGADGAAGVVARGLGLRAKRWVGRGVVAEVRRPGVAEEAWPRGMAMDFGAVPRGYGWVFPKLDHLNVGVYTRKANLRGLREFLARYLRTRLPGLDPAVLEAAPVAERLIPLGGRREPLHADRAIIVGDAAGLCDPFTGEGIYYALRSGVLGAEALAQALACGSSAPLAEYSARVHREMLSNFRSSRLVGAVFSAFPRTTYRIITRPSVVRGYQRVMKNHSVRGETPYTRLVRAILSPGFFRGGPERPPPGD
jgi:geranylgeranyl reductase family protein